MVALADLQLPPGTEIGLSGWRLIDQSRIDAFAGVTGDHQFIHVDPERAARDGPFGGTVAHGFLTLSLVSALVLEALPVDPGVCAAAIVSIDKLKFLTPVRAGRRVRSRVRMGRLAHLSPRQAILKLSVTMEVEDEVRPALTADVGWLLALDPAAGGDGVAALARTGT